MNDFAVIPADRGEGGGVVRVEGGTPPGGDCGRSVGSYAAANRTRPLGGEPFVEAQDKLVEAGERSVRTIGLRLLQARQEAIGSEYPQLTNRALDNATTGASRA